MIGSRFPALGRRFAAFGVAAVVAVPSATATPAPSPSTAPSTAPSAAPSATPLPLMSTVGGPRLAERGLIFGGGADAPPETAGASYVVADADTGQVLAAKDPHGHYRPASTLKTLLALTMAPRVDAGGEYTADAADTEVEGTRVGLVEHQTYPIDLIWYGLFLRSGNDAANAIAKAGADGDVAKAVRMMNAEARRLQAYDTTAVNPSGLDADGQYSSAYDLTLFGRAALGRGDLRTYMRALKVVFPGDHTKTSTPKNSKPFDVFTGNRLILHGVDDVIGVKNGYTTLAHNTFISAMQRDGHTIIATLMSSPGNISGDAQALLEWGVANTGKVIPVGTLVDPVSTAVVTAEDGMALGPGSAAATAVPTALEQGPEAGGGLDDTPVSSGGSSRTAVAGTFVALAVAGLGALVLRRRRP